MKFRILIPIVLTTAITGMAYAVEPSPGARLGTTAQEIENALVADGYEMTRYDKRAALIVVHAVKDDVHHVLFLNGRTGKVAKSQQVGKASQITQQRSSAMPGVGDDKIRSRLAAEGYQITKYERERGEIEVYAMRDGRQWELKIDPRTGKTMRIEAED